MNEIFYLDGGKVLRAELANLQKIRHKPIWIDVTSITKQEGRILAEAFGLHPLTEEDFQSCHTRIKIEEFPTYLVFIVYNIAVKGAAPNESFEMQDVDLVIGKNWVITNHAEPLQSIEALKKDEERLASLFKNGVDFIFHRVIDAEIDNYFPVLDKMDDLIDKIEEEVTKEPKPESMKRILGLKRLLTEVRKTVFHHRSNLTFLAHGDAPFLSKKLGPYLRDVYDHSIRVSDQVDNYREAVINTFDVYMAAVNNKLNEIMKTLSVIATIALPLTVISSIYGTNFTNLPGSKIYFGFWGMIALMMTVCFCMLMYFRRRGWF